MMMNVEIPVAWGEMDAYGHVNNAVFLRWFETARIAWFEVVKFPEQEGKTGPVLRAAKVEYLAPVKYPDTVSVAVDVAKIGRTSVTLTYELTSAAQKKIVATGESVVVYVSFVSGEPLAIDQDARARIEANRKNPAG